MKRRLLLACLCVLLNFSLVEAAAQAPQESLSPFQIAGDMGAYQLSKYDVLNLSILGFPDESWMNEITVGPDGYVNLPYTGAFKMAGLTIPEATAVLKEKLGQYLAIPELAIIIKQYGARQVYVMGAVNKEGIYPLTADKMNVFAALSSAGGIAPKGRPKHIAVVRTVGDAVFMKEVDFDAFVKKQDIAQNLRLQDGDMVYVPESGKLLVLQEILPSLSTAAIVYNYTKK